MTNFVEKERHRKAFMYTAIICAVLLLLFIIISWKTVPPPPPPPPELIEVNLGNNDDGLGEEQPLIKGDGTPEIPVPAAPQPEVAKETNTEESVTPDDNAEATAAPVVKAEKKNVTTKNTTPTPKPVVTPPIPKPQKPKLVYNGPGTKNGNNKEVDNGYTMQGKNPIGKGDYGIPTGDKDSYGDTPGGKKGGPKVISGNRKVINYYSFTGDLPKATINAVIKVSPAGVGTFIKIGQGSTSFSKDYANAITGYLRNIKFDKADDESTVTVQFNFTVQ
ncbi:hypothetical protein ACFOWM_02660 [Ferruginibacter yonginensis]|uniref:Energy transducer TonB n=1 Tax=Ferruginibacter yonginensis TaxID=1310416 RepID=A0ABV8QQ68_9BACT